MTLGSDGDHKRRIKKSRKQEKQTAERYKGSRNAGSGSGWMRKNDVRSHEFLIENKFTENTKSCSIKFKDLVELEHRAIMEDRIPVLQFEIQERRYVILTEDDFTSMLNG
jgi:hypothetical protein